MTVEPQEKVRTPLFPRYSTVHHLLVIWDGVRKALVRSLINKIAEQTGSPQSPVNWSDPDSWISERLSGDERELASRIWQQTHQEVNPRYVYGPYMFINTYQLLSVDSDGIYRISERGRAFLECDDAVLRELDEAEGLPQLLAILATKPHAKRGDLLPEWSAFLKQHSKFRTSSTFNETLRVRLNNLAERGFVEREGNTYTATSRGLEYASTSASDGVVDDPRLLTMRAVATYNSSQRQALREQL